MADNSSPKCWAESLGGCDRKIRGEHLVSKCLFDDDAITVQGFPWCLKKPKTIGLSSLVRNILCKSHNSELSSLDSVALDAFNAFRESVRLSNVRRGIKADYLTVKRFPIDGALLERWFLKTLINLSTGGQWIVGDGGIGAPSDGLVQTAFGSKPFKHGAGLYIAAQSGEQVDSMDRFALTPRTLDTTLVAGSFNFRGYRFYLNLLPRKFEMDGDSHLLYYRDVKMKYRVRNYKGRELLSHEIKFR